MAYRLTKENLKFWGRVGRRLLPNPRNLYTSPMKVLIVDDNFKLRSNIREFLRAHSVLWEEAANGEEALTKAQTSEYDVIVLDMNMPIMNGQTCLARLRELAIYTPVLALTSNSLVSDKLDVFALGADDYVTKPFDLSELLARLTALYRRSQNGGTAPNEVVLSSCRIDLDKRRVFDLENQEIPLANKEYRIVEFLAMARGNPKSKGDILEAVWGERQEDLGLDTMTLDVHLSSIRKKIGPDAIKTLRSIGYVME